MANCVWTSYNVLHGVSISYKMQHPEGGNYQSTSQVRKLRLREAKKLAQGHGGKSQKNLYREQPEGTFCMCVCGSWASSPQRKTLTPTPKAPPTSGPAGMGRLGEPGTCLSERWSPKCCAGCWVLVLLHGLTDADKNIRKISTLLQKITPALSLYYRVNEHTA